MRERLLCTPMTCADETNHFFLSPHMSKEKEKLQTNLTGIKILPKEYHFLYVDYQQMDHSWLQP